METRSNRPEPVDYDVNAWARNRLWLEAQLNEAKEYLSRATGRVEATQARHLEAVSDFNMWAGRAAFLQNCWDAQEFIPCDNPAEPEKVSS